MSLYVPNIGEMEMMRSFLATQEWHLGLHKNVVTPDGSLSMLNIEPMPTGGGRGYAPKTLAMDFATVLTADKWRLSINTAGKAEAQYSDDYQEFEFNAADVADGNTVYGVYAFTYTVPFSAGQAAGPVKVGDIITGLVSGATAEVTAVILTSGSWAGNDAAGYFFIKDKTGTFQNAEALQVGAVTLATSATGGLYGGDANQQIILVESLPTPQLVDVSGRKIRVLVKWTLKSE